MTDEEFETSKRCYESMKSQVTPVLFDMNRLSWNDGSKILTRQEEIESIKQKVSYLKANSAQMKLSKCYL